VKSYKLSTLIFVAKVPVIASVTKLANPNVI